MEVSEKKVLVTGGAGFIGSHIVDRFLGAGAEVLVIDDLSSGNKKNLADGVRLEEVGIETAAGAAAIRSFAPDILVHAAAQISVRVSMEEPLRDADVNVKGVLNLLHALSSIEGRELPHVVFLSTGGAMYGEVDLVPTPESVLEAPTSFYGLHKRYGELYLDFWAREHGLSCTALRLANVYGPRQNPHGEAGVVAIFAERLLANSGCTIFGDGGQTRDFVYVGDVVDAVFTACASECLGIYNVGTGVETSVQQLFDAMQQVSESSSELTHEEERAGEQRRSAIDATLLRESSSWEPATALKDGLRQTIDYFRALA